MLPTLTEGSIYDVIEVPITELHVGDIVVFYEHNMVICHRIIKIVKTGSGMVFYKTKGDNCSQADAVALTYDNILGKIQLCDA